MRKVALSCHGTKREKICNLGKGLVPEWHRHPLSSGTATPRAVPTRIWQRRVESGWFGVITRHASVHHHGCGGAPPGHRLGMSGAIAVLLQRAGVLDSVTAVGTTTRTAIHHHFIPETWSLGGMAGWSPPPLGWCHRHPVRCPND